MITTETIKDLIKNKIKVHNKMVNMLLNDLDEGKITEESISLNVELGKESALKWLLEDIKDLENK